MVNLEIKEGYRKLEDKYSLPSFSELNNLFYLDSIDHESDLVLREVRRIMMGKVSEYARLIELLFTPNSAPPMFVQFVKKMTSDDLNLLDRVYRILIPLEFLSWETDLKYSEAKEAAVVKEIYGKWISVLSDISSIIGLMKRNFESGPSKKDRTYFG